MSAWRQDDVSGSSDALITDWSPELGTMPAGRPTNLRPPKLLNLRPLYVPTSLSTGARGARMLYLTSSNWEQWVSMTRRGRRKDDRLTLATRLFCLTQVRRARPSSEAPDTADTSAAARVMTLRSCIVEQSRWVGSE